MGNESRYENVHEAPTVHRNDICDDSGEVIVHWITKQFAWLLPGGALTHSRRQAIAASKIISESRCASSTWKVVGKRVFVNGR